MLIAVQFEMLPFESDMIPDIDVTLMICCIQIPFFEGEVFHSP